MANIIRFPFRRGVSYPVSRFPGSSASRQVAADFIFEANASRTATLSKALDSFTLASSGVLPVTGQTGLTLGSVSIVSTGALAIQGAASVALDTLSLSSTGALAISGSLGATLGGVSLDASGQIAGGIQASVTITLGDVVFYAAGNGPLWHPITPSITSWAGQAPASASWATVTPDTSTWTQNPPATGAYTPIAPVTTTWS